MSKSFFKFTSDYFSGAYKIASVSRLNEDEVKLDGRHAKESYVHVKLSTLREGDYRVGVWGNDDFGMVFDTLDYEEALSVYQQIASEDDVLILFLEELGFSRF